MKIRLTIDLELPADSYSEMSDNELAQVLFDNYVNFANCQHNEVCVNYMARINSQNSDRDNVVFKMIIEHHKVWSEICSKQQWMFKKT